MRVPLVVRMTAPVVGVSIVLLGVGLVSAWYVERLHQNAARVLASNVASIRAAEELEIGIRKIRSRVNTFRLTGVRTHLSEIPGLRSAAERWLDEAERLATTEREQELMAGVRRGYERFFERCDQLIEEGADAGPRDEQWSAINEGLNDEVFEPAHEYLDINTKVMARSSEQSEVMANRMIAALLLLGTTGPVAGLLAGFGIARGVSRSIVQLSVPIRDTAGKLNEVVGPITVSAGAGFEELEAQLRKMADHVATVVEQLQQSQREVLRAEQLAAVGQLAAGVAHELRNPLMSITLLAQAAAKEGQDACLRGKDIEVLQIAATRLEKSLQSLLDFARPSKPEKRRFELREVVDETISLMSGRAARQSVQIAVDGPTEPLSLVADAGQIRQVLLNLLINALDAVSAGGTIHVQLAGTAHHKCSARDEARPMNSTDQNNCVCIRVTDTGSGISTELGPRIFEPFVSSKDTGTGLGLTISKRIVEAHGGRIEAKNRADGGAEFTVRLPLAERGE